MRRTAQGAVQEDTSTLSTLLEHVPDLLQGFAAFENTELPNAIDAVLARLGTLVDADRTYLFRVWHAPDGSRFIDNDHEWCAPGITPQIEHLQGLPIEMAAAWLPQLEARQPVYIPRVSDLPETRPDRDVLLEQGIRSLLVTPLLSAGELVGFIGYDAVRAERAWSPNQRLLLGVVADAVCSALLRQRALRELSHSERRFRIFARLSTDLGVVLDDAGGLLEVSASARPLLGWDPAAMLAHPGANTSTPRTTTTSRTPCCTARCGRGSPWRPTTTASATTTAPGGGSPPP